MLTDKRFVRFAGCAALAAILAVALGGCADHGAATIPASCPSDVQEPVGQLPTSRAHSTFVPFDASSVLLCYYPLQRPGGPTPTGSMQQSLVSDAAAAQRLAGDLQAAVTPATCRNSVGGDEVDAYFQGPAQSIEVQIGGLPSCPGARNGGKSSALIPDTVVSDLEGLLGLKLTSPVAP